MILVGVCGFPRARREVYRRLDAVELQETFYSMPSPERMGSLRGEAPQFHFTVKVFQGLTHGPGSPTMRRARGYTPRPGTGLLQPTGENLRLWEEFKAAVGPLRPEAYVFQTPPSLEPGPHVPQFFSAVAGRDAVYAWEPRGQAAADERLLEDVEALGVVVVTDPLRRGARRGPVHYFRLHGLGGREVNYRYRYTDEDLSRLAALLRGLGGETAYVMFNNVHMFQDALRLRALLNPI